MKNPFELLDSWLIERVFEPLLWWLEVHTGRNNFWYAMGAAVITAASMVLYDTVQAHYAWAVVDGLIGIWTMIATTVLERMVGKKSMNLFRSRWVTRTLVLVSCLYYVLTPSSFPTGGVLSQLWVYSVPIWFYLTACNPMPPGWKKQVRTSAKKLAVGHS